MIKNEKVAIVVILGAFIIVGLIAHCVNTFLP